MDDQEKYALLLACFRSGQMSAKQMQEHLSSDPSFKAFVEDRTANGLPQNGGAPLKNG